MYSCRPLVNDSGMLIRTPATVVFHPYAITIFEGLCQGTPSDTRPRTGNCDTAFGLRLGEN